MAGIVCEAGLAPTVPCVHAHTALDYPDTLDVVNATVERLDMDLEVIEPTDLGAHMKRLAKKFGGIVPQPGVNGYDVWDLLRIIPSDVDVVDVLRDLQHAIAAGNMCIAHMYEVGYDGAYVGIRADESRGRKEYARRWGYEHGYKDGTHNVTPLLAWSGLDVFAFLVSRGLPIHPFYRLAYEAPGAPRDPAMLRVDISIPPAFPASQGAMALIARAYPRFWRQLLEVRPELRYYSLV